MALFNVIVMKTEKQIKDVLKDLEKLRTRAKFSQDKALNDLLNNQYLFKEDVLRSDHEETSRVVFGIEREISLLKWVLED